MTTLYKSFTLSPREVNPQPKININFNDIVAYINDRNSGAAAWDKAVIGVGSSAVNLEINTAATTAALGATLLNSPVAGNPATWIQVKINGTNRYIPCW